MFEIFDIIQVKSTLNKDIREMPCYKTLLVERLYAFAKQKLNKIQYADFCSEFPKQVLISEANYETAYIKTMKRVRV